MIRFLNPLRAELNQEIASLRLYRIRVSGGSEVAELTHYKAEITSYRIPILKATIKKLKRVKPSYQWLNPKQ